MLLNTYSRYRCRYLSIISKELMFKKRSLIGYKPLFYKLDEIEGLDIDTITDFEFAEYMHKKLF